MSLMLNIYFPTLNLKEKEWNEKAIDKLNRLIFQCAEESTVDNQIAIVEMVGSIRRTFPDLNDVSLELKHILYLAVNMLIKNKWKVDLALHDANAKAWFLRPDGKTLW